MKKNYKYLSSLIISIFIVSCNTSENPIPVVPSQNNDEWQEIANFDELSDPILHFFNDEIGIIAGKVNYDTVKLGSLQDLNFGEDSVVIIDNRLLYTVPSVKYPLYKTYDGGKSWNPISGFFKSSIIDMYFLDNSVGFIVTRYEGVFKTIDGGDSWTRILGAEILFVEANGQSTSIANSVPEKISFYDSDNGIVTMTYGPSGRLHLSTKNGGQNWDYNYLPFKLNKIIFPEKSNKGGYAVTSSNSIVKTDDGANTWSSVFEDFLGTISFVDVNKWLCLNRGKLYETFDGGITYCEIRDTIYKNADQFLSNDINNILSLHNEYCLVYYEKLVIISQNDYKIISTIDTHDLYFSELYCPDINTIYGSTNTGRIYKYVFEE